MVYGLLQILMCLFSLAGINWLLIDIFENVKEMIYPFFRFLLGSLNEQ